MSGNEAGPSNPLRMSTSSTTSSVDKPLPRLSSGASSSSSPRRASARLSSSGNTGGAHVNGHNYNQGHGYTYTSVGHSRYPSNLGRGDPTSTTNRRISAGSAGGSSTHSRRPSRAERFEAIVDAARNVLRRGEYDLNRVSPQEWLDTCYSLLKVIDGMSKQLSTHDELAAQLKIAQSNLTLAETHSEFLEETLRRRGSQDQGSSSVTSSLALAATTPATSSAAKRTIVNQSGGTRFSETLKGLGLDSTGEFELPKPSFFSRLPSSKRKNVSSIQSSSSDSPTQLAQTSTELPKDVEGLTAEVFQLRSLVHNLEAACKNWQSGSETLSKTNEDLVRQVVDLEKTNSDLMAELENLSMELFQEANTMVAEERKARAKAESETAGLRNELESMSGEIERLRRELEDGGLEGVRRAEEELEKALRVKGPRMSNVPLIAPTSAETLHRTMEREKDGQDDDGNEGDGGEDGDKASKKWYNFGRTASGKRRTPSPLPETATSPPTTGISSPVLISSSVPNFAREDASTPRASASLPPPRPSLSPALSPGAAFSPLVVHDSTPTVHPGGQSPASFSMRSEASTGAFHTPLMGVSPALSSKTSFSPSMPSTSDMSRTLSNASGGSHHSSGGGGISRKISRPTALDLQSAAKRTPQDILAEEERKNRSPMSPNDARWREKAGSLATTPISPLMPASATMSHANVRKSPSLRSDDHHHSSHLSAGTSLSGRKPISVQRSNSYDQRPSTAQPPAHKIIRPGTAGSNVPPSSSSASASSSHLRINTDLPRRPPVHGTVSAGGSGALSSGRLSPYQSHFSASTSVSSNLSAYSNSSRGAGGGHGKAGQDLEKLMKSIEDMNGDLFGEQ